MLTGRGPNIVPVWFSWLVIAIVVTALLWPHKTAADPPPSLAPAAYLPIVLGPPRVIRTYVPVLFGSPISPVYTPGTRP